MIKIFFTLFIFLTMQASAQQTNFHFSHTDSTTVAAEKIWQVWTDVPNWKQWDKGLKEALLKGDFKVGAKGKLVPDKGPKSTFRISELVPGQSYSFKTRIALGFLIIKRTLDAQQGITYFTHDVKFTGPLKKLFGKKLGKKYRAVLPAVMNNIKQIAASK